MEVHFLRIDSPTDPYIKDVERIYTASFPAEEQKPFFLLKQQVAQGKSQLWIGIAQGKVSLMAIYSGLAHPDFYLLEYMAVLPEARNQQMGSQFLKFLFNRLRNTRQHLLFEIEHPAHGDNRPQRKKRLDFYLRNQAFLLKDVPYKLPSFGAIQPIEMLLLVGPYAGSEELTGDLVKALIRSIYTDLYGKKDDNLDLASFIDLIPEKIQLAQTADF